MSRLRNLLWTILPSIGGIALVLLLGSCLILGIGSSPLKAGTAFYQGAFGSVNSLGETFLQTAPLLLAALGVAISFQARVWNIGAEGQMYVGGLAATAVALALEGLPGGILIAAAILAGFLGGGLWAALAGVIKEKFRVNEIISTLMLNYVAIKTVSYFVHGPMKGSKQFFPESAYIAEVGRLPVILPGSRLHAGILLAFVLAAVVYFVMSRTVLGFRIQVIGDNPEAARLGGIPISRYVVFTLFLSGGLAGMAGMGEVAGVHYRLIETLSPGYGYIAILVALMGRLQAGGVVVASIFVAALLVGVDNVEQLTRVPATLADIVVVLAVLSVLARDNLRAIWSYLGRRGHRVG